MNSYEAQQRVKTARTAQVAWGALPISQRCKAISRIRQNLARDCETVAAAIAQETSKLFLDALSGDVMVSLEHLRYCEIHAARDLRPFRRPKPSIFFRDCKFETHYEPHGVVLVLGPSNYPLQLSLIPLSTALVAGNAVIVKCSEKTPATAALIAQFCANEEIPKDLVQVITEGPDEVSLLLDARPDFVFFTGSSKNGLAVARKAAVHLIPGIFELGGKDATIVFADSDIERAVEGITYGAFSNAGRVCVAVKRAYIESSIYTGFVEQLKARVARLRVGSGLNVDVPANAIQDCAELRRQVQDAVAQGAKLIWPEQAGYIGEQPVILAGVPSDSSILNEESFGPVLCVKSFESEHEAVRLANSTPFALSSSIWTRDRSRVKRVASQLNAGSCAINDVIRAIANPYTPFGGNGQSGYGRYHGVEGLRAFSRTKTVMTTYTRRKREANWFPFKKKTSRQLVRLLRFRHGSSNILARLARIIFPALLCALLPIMTLAQSSQVSELCIVAELTPDAHGDLGYLVFGSAAGFPGDHDKALRHGFVAIPSGAKQMHIELTLPPGRYAVSLYEDLNQNHKLDHNWVGVPKEPVGVSNNPAARFGPPRFQQSLFELSQGAQSINIRMVHP